MRKREGAIKLVTRQFNFKRKRREIQHYTFHNRITKLFHEIREKGVYIIPDPSMTITNKIGV